MANCSGCERRTIGRPFATSNRKQIPRPLRRARNDNSAIRPAILRYGRLFLALHGVEAAAVEFQKMRSVFFRSLGLASALKSDTGRSGFAVAGGSGDELHQVECDVFVAAHAASTVFSH